MSSQYHNKPLPSYCRRSTAPGSHAGTLVTAVVDALTGPDSETRPSHRCGELSALIEQPGDPERRQASPVPDVTSVVSRAALSGSRLSL